MFLSPNGDQRGFKAGPNQRFAEMMKVQRCAGRAMRRWSGEGITVAVAAKVAIASAVYCEAPYAIHKADEVSA